MICPHCGNNKNFRVDVTFQGTVDLAFDAIGEFDVVESEPTDSEWEDHSCVLCLECLATYPAHVAETERKRLAEENGQGCA
jgi:hypothetical protein